MIAPHHQIALHGPPRSGTTWLGEIFNSHPAVKYAYQPLFSYAYKDFLTEGSDADRIDAFYDLLRTGEDPFVNQTSAREAGKLPRFAKVAPTHVVYKEVRYHHILPNLIARKPDLRVVCILRDPRATISSWLQAPREFRADLGWQVAEEWRHAPSKNQDRPEEFNGYEKWKEAATLFMSLHRSAPDQVALIRYADLIAHPERTVAKLFAFCDLPPTSRTTAFIGPDPQGANDPSDPYSVDASRTRDDGWRTTLPRWITEEIEADLAGSPLATFLDGGVV